VVIISKDILANIHTIQKFVDVHYDNYVNVQIIVVKSFSLAADPVPVTEESALGKCCTL
jgi:hypothetical protein